MHSVDWHFVAEYQLVTELRANLKTLSGRDRITDDHRRGALLYCLLMVDSG